MRRAPGGGLPAGRRSRASASTAGGGAALGGVVRGAARAGLSGLEAISGIPSSIGGAVRINAGAYGGEIFDVLETVRLVSRAGERARRPGGGDLRTATAGRS